MFRMEALSSATFSSLKIQYTKCITSQTRQTSDVVSPKLYNQIEYNNHTILVVGIIPEKEYDLKKWWNITGTLPQNDTNQIMIGSASQTCFEPASWLYHNLEQYIVYYHRCFS